MVYISTEPSVDTDLLQADSGRVFELCLDFLGLEMQPSVRHYQEWMCMRLVSRFPGLVAKLWPAFVKVSFLILSVIRKWISFLAVWKCFIQFNSVYWYHTVDKQSIFIVNDYEDLHTIKKKIRAFFTLLHFKGNEGSSHSYNLLYITHKTSTSIICIQKFDYYVHTICIKQKI